MNLERLKEGAEFHSRYRVSRLIKAGGMGAVYEVFDTRSDRKRALKVLHPSLVADTDIRSKFEAEAKVTGAIESEHLVEVFDAGIDPTSRCPFLVMELLRGEEIEAVSRRGPMPAHEVCRLLTQVAMALQKTHAAGIIHRDLKPENLFLTYRDDGSPRMRILDFGIAKVIAKASSGAVSQIVGTPLYMAPEQVHGAGVAAPAVDLYALAQITYTLLVGRPYWADEVATLDLVPFLLRISQGTIESASERARRQGQTLPPGFDAWFSRATAATPTARFADAREMIAQLAPALGLTAASRASSPAMTQRLPPEVPVLEARSQTPTTDQAALSRSSPLPQASAGRSLPVVTVVTILLTAAAAMTFGVWRYSLTTPSAAVGVVATAPASETVRPVPSASAAGSVEAPATVPPPEVSPAPSAEPQAPARKSSAPKPNEIYDEKKPTRPEQPVSAPSGTSPRRGEGLL